MTYWTDKVCVITGGSAGLGLAVGCALAAARANVVLVARRQQPLDAAVVHLRRDGGQATAIAADVIWQNDVDRVTSAVVSQYGRLDLLCNCAGRSSRGAVLETTPDDFQQLLDVNLMATVRMTRAMAPQLIAAKGHLVNIGSLASKIAPRFLGAYPASKFAVAAYTQQLRLELGPQGLHVMLVCPGPIARDDSGERYAGQAPNVPAAAQGPGGGAQLNAIPATRLAKAILRGCERRTPELVMPAKAKLLFALSQLSASWGDWLLERQMRR